MPESACPPINPSPNLTLSEVSWGESSGIYPQTTPLYDPSKWDAVKLCNLLRARAAMQDVSTRNSDVRKGKPDPSSPLDVKLSIYHMMENFPTLSPEITADVKWFYLSPAATMSQHPTTPGANVRVKTYGPFYNSGGGDVPTGDVYIHFFKAG